MLTGRVSRVMCRVSVRVGRLGVSWHAGSASVACCACRVSARVGATACRVVSCCVAHVRLHVCFSTCLQHVSLPQNSLAPASFQSLGIHKNQDSSHDLQEIAVRQNSPRTVKNEICINIRISSFRRESLLDVHVTNFDKRHVVAQDLPDN